MNKVNNTIEAIVLVGALGLAGCQSQSAHYDNQSVVETRNQPVQKKDTTKYSFDSFGNVSPNEKYNQWAVVADMDGDGDMDIVAIDNNGDITLYKNNIPQKNK